MARKQSRRITSRRGSGKGKSGANSKTRLSLNSITRHRRAQLARSRPASPVSKPYRAPSPSTLSAKQLRTRSDVLAAHADMLRDPNLIAAEAAKNNGVRVNDFWKYIPKAFKKSRGRIRAVADRYVRRLEIPGPDGPIIIKIRGSKARSEVARFRNDVFRFLQGDLTAIDKWRGVSIQGHELLTDTRILRLLGQQGNLPEHFGSEQAIPYYGGAA
jgi:hypothetical protein